MPKQSITVEKDFHAQVQAYANEKGISWSAAIVTLAARQLQWERPAAPRHGGDRKSAKYQSERYQQLKREYDAISAASSRQDHDPASWQDWYQDIREAGYSEEDFQ